MDERDAAQRGHDGFAAARVARLATLRPGGAPHLVPVVFAVEGDRLWFAVDGKPKTTRALQRLANIESDPRVSVIVDHYDDDWTQLWWVRADGRAEVAAAGSDDEREGLDALVAKYEQYRTARPAGPVVVMTIERWSAWSGQ